MERRWQRCKELVELKDPEVKNTKPVYLRLVYITITTLVHRYFSYYDHRYLVAYFCDMNVEHVNYSSGTDNWSEIYALNETLRLSSEGCYFVTTFFCFGQWHCTRNHKVPSKNNNLKTKEKLRGEPCTLAWQHSGWTEGDKIMYVMLAGSGSCLTTGLVVIGGRSRLQITTYHYLLWHFWCKLPSLWGHYAKHPSYASLFCR